MSLSENGAKIRISPPYCPDCGDFHGPQGFRIGYIWYFCSMDHPTASALDYTARDYTASLPVADFIARFRDAERIAGYCRACPNYGRSWACPPFDFDLEEYLSGYATALIVATKITPAREAPDDRRRALPDRRGGLHTPAPLTAHLADAAGPAADPLYGTWQPPVALSRIGDPGGA